MKERHNKPSINSVFFVADEVLNQNSITFNRTPSIYISVLLSSSN